MGDGFDQFWKLYPKKLARLDAMKAYNQALRITTPDAIQAGLERFLEHLPDEARFIPHAGTWLRAGRYEDEYEPVKPVRQYWADECREVHGGTCSKQWEHATRMLAERETA